MQKSQVGTEMFLKMLKSTKLRPIEVAIMLLVSFLMILASFLHWWPLPMTEVLGFVTGGVCVWLVVRDHIWNWPVGLANNIFFFVLFLQGRLFADMSLQVVYLALGVYGWLNWLYGGQNRSLLTVSRTTRTEWGSLVVILPLLTLGLWKLLIFVNGAAPFWDSLTTVLSLIAQYLLSRKRFENWFFWIAADIIYIPLYFSRNLPLTGILYAVFLVMCLFGLVEWRGRMKIVRRPVQEAVVA